MFCALSLTRHLLHAIECLAAGNFHLSTADAAQAAAAAGGIMHATHVPLRTAVNEAEVATSPARVVDATSAHAPRGLTAIEREERTVNDEAFKVNQVCTQVKCHLQS